MTPLRPHMIAALQRSGKRERTPQSSVRAVRLLAQFYGTSLSTCPSGGPPHRLDHAGGNRHGPPCQHHTTQLWLHHQLDTQLPGPYVLLAFHRP